MTENTAMTPTQESTTHALTSYDPGQMALATEIDRQVATAKAYPRSLARVLKQARDMATVNPEVAGSCYYHLKRKDKNSPDGFKHIIGPSIRVAEIILSSWGNIRSQAQIVEEGARHVTARGTAWDMEANVLASVDVRRSIWGHYGRYSDDMIAVTAQAAISLALRNALIRVVPRVYIDELVEACKQVAGGDTKSLSARWQSALQAFGAMGVREEQLYSYLGIEGGPDLRTDHIKMLIGLHTAIKDGEITIEEAFSPVEEPAPKAPKASAADAIKEKLRNQASPAPAPAPEEPKAAKPAGTIGPRGASSLASRIIASGKLGDQQTPLDFALAALTEEEAADISAKERGLATLTIEQRDRVLAACITED